MKEDIYSLAEGFREELLHGERAAARKLVGFFAGVDRKISEQLEKLLFSGKGDSPGFSRLLAARESLKRELAKIPGLADILGPEIAAAGRLAENHVRRAARELLGEKYAAAITFDAVGAGPGVNLMQAASHMATARIRELLESVAAEAVRDLEATLGFGIAAGENPLATARRITAIGNTTQMRAATIARTETLRAYRETTRAIYGRNADIVRGYIWVAAVNSGRTCAVCFAMHGSYHETGEPFGTHPNCRCVMVPYLGGRSGIPKGEKLFAKLPPERQKAILGPARYRLYREGVPLSNVVGYANHPKWGPIRFQKSARDFRMSGNAESAALGLARPPARKAASILAAKEKLARTPDFSGIDIYEGTRVIRSPRNIRVSYESFAKERLRLMLGRDLADNEIGGLAGALDGSQIRIVSVEAGLRFEIFNPHIQRQVRTLLPKADGGLFFYNDLFVKTPSAPAGIGLRSFATQVIHSQRYGVNEIRTHAAGSYDNAFNGYYTWAVFGYNDRLRPADKRRFPPSYRDARDLHELLGRAGGREVWLVFGRERLTAVFSLSEDSPHVRRLKDYLREKGYRIE